MKRNGKYATNLVGVAHEYSDGITKTQIVLLSIVSLLCAVCNVAGPIVQKQILSHLDASSDIYLWLFLAVTVAGAVLLVFENFLNIAIMMRFRRELESAMESSLAFKEQVLLAEKGVGVFAASITGDSEQLSRVLGAGWFSIVFNLLGAIVSIIISATWELFFLLIASIAYLLILVIIYVFNRISVHYFRLEKEVTYVIGAKIREMVDCHRSIMAYGSYLGYQDTLKEELDARERYVRASERASAIGSSLIKLVQGLALAVFFFMVVYELRGIPNFEERSEYFPTVVALVSFFGTIFAPISALNTTYNNASKFRAFYEPFKGVVEHEGFGELPSTLDMKLCHVSSIVDHTLVLQDIDVRLDRIYGVVGLEGEGKAELLSYLRGESFPPTGHIELGGARIAEIEKSLRLSVLTFNPSHNEVFGGDLEYNVALGKPLLNDREYEEKKQEYFEKLSRFFSHCDQGNVFSHGKAKGIAREILKDFFSIDERLFRAKSLQNEIVSLFKGVENRKKFIATVGNSIFATKYAKRSRYRRLVDQLDLTALESRPFGVSGRKLPDSERALVLLARFLLPETDNPFVLIDPLEHLPPDSYKAAIKAIKEATVSREGLIFSPDINALASLSDEILFFEEGTLVEHASHSKLLQKSKEYQKLCAELGLKVKKK